LVSSAAPKFEREKVPPLPQDSGRPGNGLEHDHLPLSIERTPNMTGKPSLQPSTASTPSDACPADSPASADHVVHNPVRRKLRLRWTLTAAVLTALVCVASAAILPFDSATAPAEAATPPPLSYELGGAVQPAAQRLGQLAAAAEGDAADASAARRNRPDHLRAVSWSLFSQINGEQETSAVVAVERETWRALDNSGRITERHQPSVFTSTRHRQAWQDDGALGADAHPRTSTYPPGQFPAHWPDRPPLDAGALAQWLQRNHATDAGAMGLVTAVTDLLLERVLGPAERAAVIRLLAQVPGLTYAGATADRAGRRGEAFSVVLDGSGLPTRYTLVIERTAGQFLAHEQELIATAGRLNVAIPAVIRYDTYLVADHAAAPH